MALLIGFSALGLCSSCGGDARSSSSSPLPDPALARRAVETSLKAWCDSPGLPLSGSPAPKVMFVDQRRRPGQALRTFRVLSDSKGEGFRRFPVKLSLAEPDESRVVAYCVFGIDPIWVYRSEDFDLIMHWECPMPAEPPVPATPSQTADKSKVEHHHDAQTPTAASIDATAG